MIDKSIIKKITATVFIFIISIGFIKSGAYIEIQKLSEYLKQDVYDQNTEDLLTFEMLETEFAGDIWKQKEFIELNGAMAKILNMQGFYSNMGIYVTDEHYIISAYEYTTTDYEFEETVAFKAFLEENGINLLYVNKPTKYIDDNIFRSEFGIDTHSNRNMDVFLSRIREAEVPVIDLRDNIREDGLTASDLFYRTDHHWTTKAALWATQIIADGLNEYCGYDIDTSIYDLSNFTFKEWQECWLGEQGRKIAEAYVGLDDYTEIKPNFSTNYTFKTDYGNYDGTFDNFINEEIYNLENDVYQNPSWHYSYKAANCINNNVKNGKILILGDSFDQVTEPFISLCVHEVDFLALRHCDDSFDLKNYILSNEYDTVIICYGQFILGAHDDPSSSNYRMFSFK